MTTPFRYYLRVRYAECDAQKVVFNSHYALYLDLASLELVRALGLAEMLVNGPIDYQLVKQTIQWKAPARFDQVLEISLRPSQLGNTSFTFSAEFRIAGQESVIATAETVYVLVDAVTLAKMPIPPNLRAALENGGTGLHANHAGCDQHAEQAAPGSPRVL
jgi:acyl-CoA thioester hydrolase